jgi:hypothetical protein
MKPKEHNLKPMPYRWKAEGAAILAKIQRARAAQLNYGDGKAESS